MFCIVPLNEQYY